MLVDSHCHLNTLDLAPFNHDFNQVMIQAKEAGVTHCLSVCVELDEFADLCQLANNYSEISISVGLHPNVTVEKEPDAALLIEMAKHPRCIAIGETGLDYYRVVEELAQESQRQRFREHIRASVVTNKPVIVHTRQAAIDTLKVMREEGAHQVGGVMHCFSEDWDIAKQALDLNFYISFSGILTFKNAIVLQEVAKRVPLEKILIETDSPYLAPMPFRGKQNHPALVKYVAQCLADLRQTDYESIAQITTKNFYNCFKVC